MLRLFDPFETTDLRLYWHLGAPPSPMNRCKLVLVSESAKKMWGEGDFLVSPWPVKARGNWDNWSAFVLASRCSTITYGQISFDLFWPLKPVWEAAQMILLYRDWIMNMSFTGQALLIRLFQHQWTIIQSFQSYEFHTNIQTKFANTHPKVKLTH